MTNDCTGELDSVSASLLATFYVISGMASFCSNAVFLWVLYKTPSQRNRSNYLLASLALADLQVGLIIDPVWVARCLLKRQSYEHPFKKTIDFLWIQTCVTTTFSLGVVSFDRYLAVTSVFRYRQIMTLKRCCLMVAFVWAASLACASTRLFVTDTADLPRLWLALTLLTFLFPLSVIAFCYFHISKAAREQSRRITSETSAEKLEENERNRKTAYTIGLVIGLFIIAWFPSLVTSFVHRFTTSQCLKRNIRRTWLWVELVAFTNSAINPWVYSLRNREFQAAFRQSFGSLEANNAAVDHR